jgi:two-component system nitrate/nitrite response regulator NarL
METASQYRGARDAPARSAPLLAARRGSRTVTVRATLPGDVLLISQDPAALVGALTGAAMVRGVRAVPTIAAAAGLRASLIVLHTNTPAEHTRNVLRARRGTPVLVVVRQFHPAEVVAALRAGALSFLIEGQFTRADLAGAVAGTMHGHSHLSGPALTAVVRELRDPSAALGDAAATGRDRATRPVLSRRELEVIELLVAGLSNADIADGLVLAEKTVRNHVTRIYRKLGVRNRRDATRLWQGRAD